MRIGLYVIGDEILSGKRQDRHLGNVSGLLKARGLQLGWAKFLGDDLDLLASQFRESFESDDLVFSCGGIGGTPDDLTRLAVAQALDIELQIHPEGLQILESRSQFFDGGITEQRKRMVEFPVGAQLIPNPVNEVPGFSLFQHYFVPGFPKMAEPMIEWVLNHAYSHLNNVHYREWSLMLFDVAESHIADLMIDLQQRYAIKAFSLPRFVDESYQIELGLKGDTGAVEEAREALIRILNQRRYHFEE